MGFGLTPSFGDRRGFMPPQLKKTKKTKQPLLQSYSEIGWKKNCKVKTSVAPAIRKTGVRNYGVEFKQHLN